MVIIGFSGTGKSVAIKHIVGLLEPDRGTVFVDGLEVPKLRRRELYALRAHIGYVFQFSALFDSLTVNENVAMGLVKAGTMTPKQIDARVQESLELVDLPDRRQHAAGRTLRRHAQARRHRALHRVPPEIPAVRRADHRPRSRSPPP